MLKPMIVRNAVNLVVADASKTQSQTKTSTGKELVMVGHTDEEDPPCHAFHVLIQGLIGMSRILRFQF